jgi:hypothetical protein
MSSVLSTLFTHSYTGVSHTLDALNLSSDLRFYLLSTVLACGYYYYLYIYKSRFQADHPQITVSSLLSTYLTNTYPMSARATA